MRGDGQGPCPPPPRGRGVSRGGSPERQAAQQAPASPTRETRAEGSTRPPPGGAVWRSPPDESPAPARNPQRRAKRGPRLRRAGRNAGAGRASRVQQRESAPRGCAFRRGATSAPAGTARNPGSAATPRAPPPARNAAPQSGAGPTAPRRKGVCPAAAILHTRSAARPLRPVVSPAVVPRAKLRRRETPRRETFRPLRRNSSPQFRALAGAIAYVAEFRAARRNSRAKLALKKRETRCLARNHFSESMFDYCLCCPA